jgi:hypothetical protein
MNKANTIIGFLLFGFVCNANAQDLDRIDRLEKEVQQLNFRLSKLESLQSNPSKTNEYATPVDGWKSVMNWRKLTTDMDYEAVKKILGEAHRVDGGQVAYWYYKNGGYVTFIDGKAFQWREPRH